jgi:hypothetical protein
VKPIRPRQLDENISSVNVTFADTGEVHVITARTNSSCHFFDRFRVGEDVIQLRLDWSDLDRNGQPMLDADFIDCKTGKHRALRGKRRDAHHTPAVPGQGRCYVREFDGFSREFNVTVVWVASVVESVSATDSCSAEVVRAADRTREP